MTHICNFSYRVESVGRALQHQRIRPHLTNYNRNGKLYIICSIHTFFILYIVMVIVYALATWFIHVWSNWKLVCEKKVLRAGTGNYIPHNFWDVFTHPCSWHLLLAQVLSSTIFLSVVYKIVLEPITLKSLRKSTWSKPNQIATKR